MRSNTRNLVIIGVCVVVLGGGVAALKLTGNDTSASSAASSEASITLLSKTSSDVASMKVTNAKGSYTIVPMKSGSIGASSAASSSSGTSDVTWTVQELNGVPVDTSETSSVVQDGFSLVASKNIGTVSDLNDFGLQNPQATVAVSFKDGSTFDYKIGNQSPTESTYYYMCGASNSDVYLVSVDAGLLEGPEYFAQKALLAISDPSGQNTFSSIKLSGANNPQPVTMTTLPANSSQAGLADLGITVPVAYDADSSNLSTLEGSLVTVTADSVVAINPDAAALKKYGFDKPTAVVDFTVNKGTYRLTAGAANGSSHYIMLGGTNAIYSIADANAAWVTSNLFSLRSKEILLPNIAGVKQLTVTVNGTQNVVNFTRTKDEKNSTQDKPVYTYAATGNNSVKLDYDKNVTNFYQALVSVAILSDATTAPSGTPAVTVQYQYYDKSNVDTIQFYPSGNRRYTVVLNGKVFGVVTQDDIDTITNDTQLLEAGKAVS